MTVYLDLVMLLNFCVDFLLILGTNRLCGLPVRLGRSAMAAAIGALYAGACFLPGFTFLGNWFWCCVSLAVMGMVSFGMNRSTPRRIALFVLLSLALGGAAVGMNGEYVIFGALCVFMLCAIAFRGKLERRKFVDVVLYHRGRKHRLIAMVDTGNTLKDPITGESVLVVGADVANALLGLTQAQLCDPIATMQSQLEPGFRLIPYRAVGQPNGMLIALKLDQVIIEKEKVGRLVAFAPQMIGAAEGYQALTGGVI